MRSLLGVVLARPIAHRGLHDLAAGRIENSLEAAEAAAAAGYGIECDIQLARDGEAVVFHDDALDRLTAETGPVAARDGADLAALPLRSGGTIPTLPRFLAGIAGRAPVVIEIKSRCDGDLRLAARAVALLAGYGGAVALKSFDAAVIAHCRYLGASCPLGIVGGAEKSSRAWPPWIDFLSWRVDDLASLRAREPALPLMSWTVRSPAQAAIAAQYQAQIVFERFRPPTGHVSDP